MAGKPSKPMTPFDKSVTPSYLYKLKLFLSFLPPSTQRFLAVYIKFSEFRYTMDYFRGLPFHAFSYEDNDVRRRYGNVPKLHGPVRPGTFLAWNLCHERRLFT